MLECSLDVRNCSKSDKHWISSIAIDHRSTFTLLQRHLRGRWLWISLNHKQVCPCVCNTLMRSCGLIETAEFCVWSLLARSSANRADSIDPEGSAQGEFLHVLRRLYTFDAKARSSIYMYICSRLFVCKCSVYHKLQGCVVPFDAHDYDMNSNWKWSPLALTWKLQSKQINVEIIFAYNSLSLSRSSKIERMMNILFFMFAIIVDPINSGMNRLRNIYLGKMDWI